MNKTKFRLIFVTFSLLLLLALSLTDSEAARLHKESWYQDKYCTGQQEVRLNDGTRVDCVTKGYAVEFGFANRWLSDIGQALHYSRSLKKHAGIFMIIESDKDLKYLEKAMWLTGCLDIMVCTNRNKTCIFTDN